MLPHIDQLTDAISAASRSPASFAACLVLVLAGIAFSWFSTTDTKVKLGVFAALFIGGGALFWSLFAPPAPASSAKEVDRGSYVVDLQYVGSRDAAVKIETALQQKGWSIYGVEKPDSAFTPSIVKYSASSNYVAAEALRNDVSALQPPVQPVRFSTDSRIKATHLELWIGFK